MSEYAAEGPVAREYSRLMGIQATLSEHLAHQEETRATLESILGLAELSDHDIRDPLGQPRTFASPAGQ